MHLCLHLGVGGASFFPGVEAAINVTPTGPFVFNVGVPVSVQFVATGGNAPYTFTVNSNFLPPELSLSSSGLLTGTPLATYDSGKQTAITVEDVGFDFTNIFIDVTVVA